MYKISLIISRLLVGGWIIIKKAFTKSFMVACFCFATYKRHLTCLQYANFRVIQNIIAAANQISDEYKLSIKSNPALLHFIVVTQPLWLGINKVPTPDFDLDGKLDSKSFKWDKLTSHKWIPTWIISYPH